MNRRLIIITAVFFTLPSILSAQDKVKAKFGKVSVDDFKQAVYSIDSSAAAVIIADVGSTEIVGNNKGSFSLLFKNYRRARIMNKNGYDLGNVEIELFTNGDAEEELENLRAITYNLENGKVVETKLEVKSAVFKDRISKNKVIQKFTFPNLKEGSIIEYEYKVKSDFVFNLQPWNFQGKYPRLWSEYNVAMPEFYNYVTLTQGYQDFFINKQDKRNSVFNMSEARGAEATTRGSFTASVTDYRWVMKEVPELKMENYTSTLRNHIARIEFQLASIGPPFTSRQIMGTWTGVARQMLDNEEFGAQLGRDNGWLKDAMDEAVRNASTYEQKARNIYAWVRDNFTCTNHHATYISQNLKNILRTRTGNVAAINLLLTAMLRKANIQADPIILSTRSNGYTHSVYPLMDRFNYVIARAMIENKEYYLDASEQGMGFGKLSYECYNGAARVINIEAAPVEFNTDSLRETRSTTFFLINGEKGNLGGSFQQVPGYFESYNVRKKIKEKGKEQWSKDLAKGFGTEVDIHNLRFDSLTNFEEPVGIFCDFEITSPKEDVLYINPMFGEGFKENPFKSVTRKYPVEMPFAIDQTHIVQMEIPAGYEIDELPGQALVKLNEDNDAVFEYRVSTSGGFVSFRSKVVVKRTFFSPEEYETLREFFNLIVKKQNEQIVFKKKK